MFTLSRLTSHHHLHMAPISTADIMYCSAKNVMTRNLGKSKYVNNNQEASFLTSPMGVTLAPRG
jgi:hypothetical protein